MTQKEKKLDVNEAWKKIIEKYDIVEEVRANGAFYIKANAIKEYKEPRLMAKWDSSESLPVALKNNKLNLLPDSRSSYVIGDFILYEPIPETDEAVTQMTHVELPELESVDVSNITSEANAINVLILSGILDDFLGTSENLSTFNGRMGTGEFDFHVNTYRGKPYDIHVKNAQCEIDGGFENDSSVVIMEAKNVLHPDFHVRQLYYPYRLWKTKVNKPIRLVFSIYSNMIYRLFEYRFNELEDYSSIELVKTKNYSLQDTTITIDDLKAVREKVVIRTDDNQEKTKTPFIQADSMERIISLMENMYESPLTPEQVAEIMDFTDRQSNYYLAAGKYLNLFERRVEEGQPIYELTVTGKTAFKMNYKQRQLKIVELILEHKIFADIFDEMIESGEMPNKQRIKEEMKELNVCNDGLIDRRSGSVNCWLKWIFNLTRI